MHLFLLSLISAALAESDVPEAPATGTVVVAIESAIVSRVVEHREGFKVMAVTYEVCAGPCQAELPSGPVILLLESQLGGLSRERFLLPAGGQAVVQGRLGSRAGQIGGAAMLGVGLVGLTVVPLAAIASFGAAWLDNGNEYGPRNYDDSGFLVAWVASGALAVAGPVVGLFSLPQVEVKVGAVGTASVQPWLMGPRAGITVGM